MKNLTRRILQAVKGSCSLAVILLAVSLSQTAPAQPVFFDTGYTSNRPPAPGPNDIYQTNALYEVYSGSGMTYQTDQSPAPGVTFVTPGTLGSSAPCAVTNVMIGTSGLAGDYGTSGGGNGTPTNDDQSYVLSLYQIAGTSATNGISTSATLIASVVSSNGLVRAPGDWMSFSNFAVFLAPGTTNAFALSRLSYNTGNNNGSGLTRFEGEGWLHLMVVTNNIGGTGATHYFGTGAGGPGTNNFYNGMTCMITNTSSVNYGVGSTIAQSVPRTNASTVFDVGISTGFLPAVFLAQPQSYQVVNSGSVTATLAATGAGSSNSANGIGGYWVLTNAANPSGRVLANGYQANGAALNSTNITTAIAPSPIGAAGATVTSTLTVSNYTSADAGSYVFIVTNSPGGSSILSSRSAVATLSIVGVQPNSFASAVISNGYGAIAYYPLNEMVDPSTGIAEAYELIGGANGIYAPAANNGAGNAAESGVGQPGWGPVPGPGSGAAPLSGLPAQGALGSLENSFVNDYVVVPNGPTNTASATGTPNSTNVTFVAWIYDNTLTETGQAGIVSYRSSVTGTGADALCGASSQNNTLGWVWDTNSSSTYNYTGGPALSSNVWSMAGLVVTPTNTVFYICNTNRGIVSVTQTIANQWQPLGGRMCIGAEEYHPYAWPGYISSVAIFTNSLTAAQMLTLFAAGESGGAPCVISNYPESSLPVLGNSNSLVLNPVIFGGGNSTAWWQMSNATTLASSPSTQGWVPVTSSDFQGTAPVSNGMTWVGALQATNFHASDAGAYEMVVSNSSGSVTSSVINLYLSGGFIAQLAANPVAYGLMSLYPLNETNDPSSGMTGPAVVACDIYGGYNGTYGTNARDGGPNLGAGFAAVAGPGLQGFSGLPTQGALGVTNDSGHAQSFVGVTLNPTIPSGDTNATIIAWLCPTASEPTYAGLVFERNTDVNGLCFGGTANVLGYTWDNNNNLTYGYNSTVTVPPLTWSMAALVITPTTTTFYLANTNSGFATATQTINNTYQAWGNTTMAIGTDTSGVPARNFVGYMSSVAIFSNSLSSSQIQALFLAGACGTTAKPLVVSQPVGVFVYPGGIATFTASALGTGTLSYQWEAGEVGSGVYTNITNGGVFSGANSPTLTITDPSQGNVADYVLVVTESGGQAVSSPATLSFLNWEQPGQGGIVTAVGTSPDGNWIASGSDDGTVKLWRTSDYGFEFTLGASGLFPVSALAFGPVGSNTVAVGYYDGSTRLWNTTNGALIRTFNVSWSSHVNYLAKVSSLAYSPNGQQLATGSGDMFSRIWSATTGALLESWSQINGEVRGTAYSPDGTLLAISGEATNLIKSIVVLYTANWSTAMILNVGSNNVAQGSNNVTSLAFSPDGTMLASGCLDQTICVWTTASWALQSAMTNNGLGITALAFAPNSQTLFAGDQGGNITSWSPSSGGSITGWPAHTGQVWSLACTVDGTKLVSGGDDHMARVWQTANGAWVTNLNSHTADIVRTCFAPDGSLIATAGNDATLRLWKGSTGAPAYALAPHTNQISALAFSPDATFLVSGGGCVDNEIYLWNPTNGAWLQTIPSTFTNGVTSLAVSPDTTLIASAGDRYEQAIKIWNRAGGTLAHTLAGHANGTSVLAFSPNGRYLASGGMFYSGTIKLWDMNNNGNLAYTFNGHTCTVVSISFNPTGTLLASAGQNDGQICVWTNNLATATPIWSNVMSGQARAVAFSPDGTLLAAAGSDAIQMWRTTNWTLIWTWSIETIGINSLSFSPNGTFLTFGRDDGTICQICNPLAAPVQLWLGATQEGRFTIANPSYSPFLSVQTSSNLSQWSTLTNLVAATNSVQFADPSPPPKERFYRVTAPQ